MAVDVKIPEVGESIVECQIGRWFKSEGDRVEKDEVLVEIETDKVTVELPAPAAGVLSTIHKQRGSQARVGEVIAQIDSEAAGKPQEEQPPSDRETKAQPKAKAEEPEAARGREGEPRVMPAAAREMAQRGVEAGQVKPTGPGGRILKEDVQRVGSTAGEQPPSVSPAPAGAAGEKAAAAPQAAADQVHFAGPAFTPAAAAGMPTQRDEVVPMSPLRRRIAQRLVEAQQTAALLTTFNEIDMGQVMALRQKYREPFQARYGIKLGFMSFFVKAAIDALKQVPQLNAEIRGTDIVYRKHYDVGIAVGTDRGLVVPVLRNAQNMSFAEVEQAIEQVAGKARHNKLTLEDLEGGTFTITNGGIYGSLLSTPIVNPPQSGILGLHAIQDRPVARDQQVVIRPMMYVALTYDHRIVDGKEAVSFLRRIKETIEDPNRLLMDV